MLHFCLTYCDYRNIIAPEAASSTTATPAMGNVMSVSDVRKEKELNDAWISLGEASRILGMSRQTVLTRAVKGELDAQYIAGRTLISRASVERAVQQGSEGAA